MRWQIPIVWVIGSVVTGTIAVLLTTGNDYLPIKPLALLSASEMLTLIVLVAALFLALFALGWRTIEGTWLRWQDLRSVVLWALLVGGAGLGGWGFAAVVTFDAEFSLTAQLILAYTCGGLPFALIAGLLARPVVVNAVAAVVTVIAVVVGFAIMRSPFQSLIVYLEMLVGGGFRPM
jgi:hypothetical protein